MINKVNELLRGQEIQRVELEKGHEIQKGKMGAEVVAYANEMLAKLGCDLLNSEIKAPICINKGKVIKIEVVKEIIKEVPGPVQVVRDMEEADKWIDKYRNLEKEMEKLKADLESERKAKGTWQSKYQNVEKEMKLLKNNHKELKKQYELLQADKEADELFDTVDELPQTIEEAFTDEDVADMEMNQYNKNLENSNITVEDVENDIPEHDRLVELKTYKNERRDDVKFYADNYYYVMASNNCSEITVIPQQINSIVTEEVVEGFQQELLTMGYRKNREQVSPATVHMNKGYLQGYFARTDAKDGRLCFSENDFFGGYITDNQRSYLWSWDGKSELCAVYYLDKVIAGDNKNKSVTTGTAKFVTKEVKAMYKDYLKKVEVVQAKEKEVIAQNTAAMNAKTAEIAAHNDKFKRAEEKTSAPTINEEEIKIERERRVSPETMAHIDKF